MEFRDLTRLPSRLVISFQLQEPQITRAIPGLCVNDEVGPNGMPGPGEHPGGAFIELVGVADPGWLQVFGWYRLAIAAVVAVLLWQGLL